MTKPMKLGKELYLSFKTSALGGVRIIVCDESEDEIDGYDSGVLFGNSTNRHVDFEKPLSLIVGKAVRLKMELMDADMFSFCSDITD